MKHLLSKLDSYNLFNYLLPGSLFSVYLYFAFGLELTSKNMFLDFFVYYFIGLVISRIGSLILDNKIRNLSFKKDKDGNPIKFIPQFKKYEEFIQAEKDNPKIILLSEMNNVFRTLFSLFFIILIVSIVDLNADIQFEPEKPWLWINISALLFVLFVFSYKKQTSYINRRIAESKIKNDHPVNEPKSSD